MADVVDESTSVRVFKSDADLLARRRRAQTAVRGRDVSNAELLHELMAPWRIEETGGEG